MTKPNGFLIKGSPDGYGLSRGKGPVVFKVALSASFLIFVAGFVLAARASTLRVSGRLVSFGCNHGRYEAEIALSNPHDFVQHPHLYVKLTKEGLYSSTCVELVEYIPELPPRSEAAYTIGFETTCESVVQPEFRLMLKRFLNKRVREEIARWAEECPRMRVEE